MTETLRNVVQKLEIIKNRTAIEAFDYIIFNGHVAVAFNGTVGILAKVEVDEPFSVPLREFTKVVKACRGNEVDLTVAEDKLHVKCGRMKASIVTNYSPDSEFDGLENSNGAKLKKVPEGFLPGIIMCARTSSNSVTMDVLNSVYVNKQEIIGSDDARLTVYKMEGKLGSYILPYVSVRDIVKFNPQKIGHKEGWVVMKDADGNTMVVRTIADDYPDYEALFKVKAKKIKVPNKASHLIQSASIFCETIGEQEEEFSEVISIKFKTNGVQVSSKNHMGKIVDSVKCKTGLKRDIQIAAHPKMFVEALELADGFIHVAEDRVVIKSDKVRHVAGLHE